MSIQIALIYGSTRPGRFCDKVAAWAISEIASRHDFSVDLIDPAAPIEPAALAERMGRADAFLVVTPEYNHSYPAPLKALIDSLHEQWHAKPVAFISYGGVSGGLRAVEHLRAVFAELQAVTIRNTVSFAHAWTQFDDAGKLRQTAAAHKTMTALLDQLKWWAVALKNARQTTPYNQHAA